jgi:cobalt-zinc-cadmium efflux system outer membrane protein
LAAFFVGLLAAIGFVATPANAQQATVDTSVPGLPGGRSSLLGQMPGAGGGSFGNLPGEGGILGGRPGVSTPKGIPTSAATPGTAAGPTDLQMPVTAPQPQPITPTPTSVYGSLDIPSSEDDGPPDGLTLDRAIDITLERSLDLRSKFFEIPMARADVLQASLRSNPVFYQDGQLLQYAGSSTRFSRAAPGGPSQFDGNITYPLDVSHKRQARTLVATRAVRVLEAAYQDAVRQRIDDVYGAYVTALAARQTVRYAAKSVDGLTKLADQTEKLLVQGSVSRSDLNRVKIQFQTTKLNLRDAEMTYRKARLNLGALMNVPAAEMLKLELNGTISDTAPAPPPIEQLKQLAVAERPDIVSYRLGVVRAEADVKLAKANAYSDVYVLWQPYTFQDNSPYGLKGQYSWSLGVTVPLPVYNRNQGGVERAKINVNQTQLELQDQERQVQIDVEEAFQEYETTKELVKELESRVVPEARQARNDAFQLYIAGERSLSEYLLAQLDFNTVVKQYLDTAVRHRQSMLSLNTVVGRRIMP